jgi:hypothetical protein
MALATLMSLIKYYNKKNDPDAPIGNSIQAGLKDTGRHDVVFR